MNIPSETSQLGAGGVPVVGSDACLAETGNGCDFPFVNKYWNASVSTQAFHCERFIVSVGSQVRGVTVCWWM